MSRKRTTTIRHGQLWADRDGREVKRGTRQRLRVVGIDHTIYRNGKPWPSAHLNDEDTGIDSWVALHRLERAFRLIEEPDR